MLMYFELVFLEEIENRGFTQLSVMEKTQRLCLFQPIEKNYELLDDVRVAVFGLNQIATEDMPKAFWDEFPPQAVLVIKNLETSDRAIQADQVLEKLLAWGFREKPSSAEIDEFPCSITSCLYNENASLRWTMHASPDQKETWEFHSWFQANVHGKCKHTALFREETVLDNFKQQLPDEEVSCEAGSPEPAAGEFVATIKVNEAAAKDDESGTPTISKGEMTQEESDPSLGSLGTLFSHCTFFPGFSQLLAMEKTQRLCLLKQIGRHGYQLGDGGIAIFGLDQIPIADMPKAFWDEFPPQDVLPFKNPENSDVRPNFYKFHLNTTGFPKLGEFLTLKRSFYGGVEMVHLEVIRGEKVSHSFKQQHPVKEASCEAGSPEPAVAKVAVTIEMSEAAAKDDESGNPTTSRELMQEDSQPSMGSTTFHAVQEVVINGLGLEGEKQDVAPSLMTSEALRPVPSKKELTIFVLIYSFVLQFLPGIKIPVMEKEQRLCLIIYVGKSDYQLGYEGVAVVGLDLIPYEDMPEKFWDEFPPREILPFRNPASSDQAIPADDVLEKLFAWGFRDKPICSKEHTFPCCKKECLVGMKRPYCGRMNLPDTTWLPKLEEFLSCKAYSSQPREYSFYELYRAEMVPLDDLKQQLPEIPSDAGSSEPSAVLLNSAATIKMSEAAVAEDNESDSSSTSSSETPQEEP
ncbi:unnamed protein product [Notodromas monacha]|uniref:Uncharacterized protein n=1 Tax=Notodromas monacha TaxID=399045 RepID=A0A7R9GHT8_9CRUS|nr:unnamed protein product [Notodromas monacha]CAG0921138.1 unnamed protein product [Notodromas monacha]